MRTTLDIDDDVLMAVRELAQRNGRSAGKVLSELARRGMTPSVGQKKRTAMRAGVPVLPSRGELITLEHVRRIWNEESI